MIAFWLWFGLARGDSIERTSFARTLREKVVLLHLVHRTEDPSPLTMEDLDRSQVLEIFREAGERGPLYAFLEQFGTIPVRSSEPRAPSLIHALNLEGLEGNGTRMRRQLVMELLEAARKQRVTGQVVTEEVERFVLIPSPMSVRLQTYAAARTQADLITFLGQCKDRAALELIMRYLRGVKRTYFDLEQNFYFHVAFEAARQIAPETAPHTIRTKIGGSPTFDPVRGDELSLAQPPPPPTPAACAGRLDRPHRGTTAGRLIRRWRRRWWERR